MTFEVGKQYAIIGTFVRDCVGILNQGRVVMEFGMCRWAVDAALVREVNVVDARSAVVGTDTPKESTGMAIGLDVLPESEPTKAPKLSAIEEAGAAYALALAEEVRARQAFNTALSEVDAAKERLLKAAGVRS